MPAIQVQGEVAELRSTLQQLQATVATLVERTTGAPTAAPAAAGGVAGGTAATDQASRIIVMANRAAESTLEDARVEAAEIVAGAKTQSFEIIRLARELANQELAAERERVARSTQEWSARRAEIGEHLRQLVDDLSGYRQGLDGTSVALSAAIAQLETAAPETPVIDELPAPDPAGFIGSELPVSDAALDVDSSAVEGAAVNGGAPNGAGETDVIDLTDSVGEELAASPRTKLFGADGSPEGDAAEAMPAEAGDVEAVAVEAAGEAEAPVNDEPAKTLRPGLFGR